MTKYAIVYNSSDYYATKFVCLFDNSQDRRASTQGVIKDCVKFTNCNIADVVFEDLPAKQAIKLIKQAQTNYFNGINIWDCRQYMPYQTVKEWYIKTFPKDELGNRIKDNIKFNDIWNLLHDVNKSLYDFIGVHDSEIRCRIFERLTQIYTVTYKQVHDLWLSSCCE